MPERETSEDLAQNQGQGNNGSCESDCECREEVFGLNPHDDHDSEDFARIKNTLSAIPEEKLIFAATEIFSALADSTRFRILSALTVGELCVSDLLCATNVSQSAVSHQLRFLRDKKLVRVHRDGQRALYSLADDHVKSLIDLALEHASE